MRWLLLNPPHKRMTQPFFVSSIHALMAQHWHMHALMPCIILTTEVPCAGYHLVASLCVRVRSFSQLARSCVHIPSRTSQHARARRSACFPRLVVSNLVQRRGVACTGFSAVHTAADLA